MQIEASHVVTSGMRCNTAQQFLGTEEQARSAGFIGLLNLLFFVANGLT
mgnify:CR=1 FL=1